MIMQIRLISSFQLRSRKRSEAPMMQISQISLRHAQEEQRYSQRAASISILIMIRLLHSIFTPVKAQTSLFSQPFSTATQSPKSRRPLSIILPTVYSQPEFKGEVALTTGLTEAQAVNILCSEWNPAFILLMTAKPHI